MVKERKRTVVSGYVDLRGLTSSLWKNLITYGSDYGFAIKLIMYSVRSKWAGTDFKT